MALKLKTAPAAEPVSLTEAKLHLRVDGTDEDTLITALIIAARDWCEGFQNRAYITQTWYLILDEFPMGDCIEIPRPPLQSITSIKYYGTDDTEYTVDSGDYFVDEKSQPGRVSLAYSKSWPSTMLRPANGVIVEFVAGYGAAAAVPELIKTAMKLIVGHLYEHREETAEKVLAKIPMAAESLLGLDRIMPV